MLLKRENGVGDTTVPPTPFFENKIQPWTLIFLISYKYGQKNKEIER